MGIVCTSERLKIETNIKDFLFSFPNNAASFSTHNWVSPFLPLLHFPSMLDNSWRRFGSDFKTSIDFPSPLWRKVAVSGGRVLHLPTCRTQKHTSFLRCQGLERAAKSDSNECHSSISSSCHTRFSKVRSE